jgi:tellurite resistance protein
MKTIDSFQKHDDTQQSLRIAHMPISIFAIGMGLLGLALAWHKAHEVVAFPAIVGKVLRGFATSVVIILIIAYIRKIVAFPMAVRDEIAHPIRINFFAAISISILLLAISWAPSMPIVASVVWGIGAILHLFITLSVMSSWIYRSHYEIKHANPSWFMPIVGNILIPILGVKIAPLELSWFFFSVGIVFWVVLLTIVLNRIFFYEPMQERLIPTIVILIAPPSIGFIAWVNLIGHLDAFAHILYHIALFFALLLICHTRRFMRTAFSIAAWAYSFPFASFTIATFQMAKLSKSIVFAWLGQILLFMVSCIVAILTVRTLMAIKRKEICKPEI